MPKVTMNPEPQEALEEELVVTTEDDEIETEIEEQEEPAISLEDLDPAEELWPGGPTVGTIHEWKSLYRDVFLTSLDQDVHIVWRKMNRMEYRRMLKMMEQMTQQNPQMSQVDASMFQEEYITELCMLFPEFNRADLTTVDAGIPAVVSQSVMDASGFVALEVHQL